MEFSNHIVQWFNKNQRNLPWRTTKDPYKIWISEIILQQTRVAQGISYYTNFINAFPNISALAEANEEDVLKLWQGLGYYSRARNIHFTAKYIKEELNGHFPNQYIELLKLKGIGPYTAAAISSICFDEKRAAVDGNVYRVLARVFEIHTPINSTNGIKEFQKLADNLISSENPGDYNQGLMELGATVCTPKKTDCNSCPLESICVAQSKNSIGQLPVKEKKLKIKNRYIKYYFVEQCNLFIMNKRTQKDIWQNMYDFPFEEYKTEKEYLNKGESTYLTDIIGINKYQLKGCQSYKHKLSHQWLNIEIQHLKILNNSAKIKGNFVTKKEALDLPVPKPIESFLKGTLMSDKI